MDRPAHRNSSATEGTQYRRVGACVAVLDPSTVTNGTPPREVAVGDAFLRECQQEEESDQSFPRGPQEWDRLRTEGIAGLVAKVSRLERELLPLWRNRLPSDSPVIALVMIYVRAAQPILRHADDVLAAWQGAVLLEPAREEIAEEARRLRISPEEARHWESQPPRGALWDDLLPTWACLLSVSSVMAAAVTGDAEH